MNRAVLFADVAGSTALYEVLGDEAALALVGRCLAEMSACTEAAGGRVVKTIGDAVMAVFPGPDEAAGAAAAMHQRVQALPAPPGVHPALRIGMHFGPVLEQGGDVFGDTVNLAARLGDQATRGQTVVTRETAACLGERFAAGLRPLFSVAVKGKAAELQLAEIEWQAPSDERTLIALPHGTPAAPPPELQLQLGERRWVMGREQRKLGIGRDAGADLVLQGRSASRSHATLERRRERIVLVDHSANGSYVSLDGRAELKIHREELMLAGHGFIGFGDPRAQAPQVLEFRLLP